MYHSGGDFFVRFCIVHNYSSLIGDCCFLFVFLTACPISPDFSPSVTSRSPGSLARSRGPSRIEPHSPIDITDWNFSPATTVGHAIVSVINSERDSPLDAVQRAIPLSPFVGDAPPVGRNSFKSYDRHYTSPLFPVLGGVGSTKRRYSGPILFTCYNIDGLPSVL
jgi:hypothetical protein